MRSGEPRRDDKGGFASGHAVTQLSGWVFQPESDLAHMAH